MKEAIIQYNDNPDADGGHLVISWKPLIRCKDCKHYIGKTDDEPSSCMIKAGYFPVDRDWYCADGERKDDNGKDNSVF